MRKLGIFAIVAVAVAGSCTGPADPDSSRVRRASPDPTAAAAARATTAPLPARVKAASLGLQRFDACQPLLTYLRTKSAPMVGPYGFGGFGGVGGGRAMPLGAMEDSATAPSGGRAAASAPAPVAGTDYSATNVQEEGVDEPDIVKSDGRRLFVIANGKVQALALDAGRPVARSSVKLATWPNSLLLSGDRLVVFGVDQTAQPDQRSTTTMIAPAGGTRIDILDVSDPARISTSATLHIDGSFVSARMVDGVIRTVTHTWGPNIPMSHPQQPGEERRIAARNREAVLKAGLESWLPRYRLERPGAATQSGQVARCANTYHPVDFSGVGFVSVSTIDPRDPKPAEGASVLGAGDLVYASARGLYVTSQKWTAAPQPAVADAPVSSVMPADATHIHRFDISDARRATYRASGVVAGSILNQFSMSEHDGHLRVAATEGRFGTASSSTVNVLAERDGRLDVVGRVTGLGRGEQIHSVRFMGDRGYVVTFRRIDPLYTLDLSDPKAPRVVGELKIPGYSAYLHPVSENLLLGVGQDATEEGRATGTQVSLFDVSNPAKPVRLHQLKIANSNSEAEWDHHAFLWWGAKKLAVIPVWEYSRESGAERWGAVAVRAGTDGITEAARFGHPETPQPDHGMVPMIRRSMVAAGSLLTISETGVMASNLDSFERQAWVAFA